MNSLVIQKTDSSPEISFLANGHLKIFGRSLPEDVHKFYDPIISWVKNLKSDIVKVDFKLEYLNTSSSITLQLSVVIVKPAKSCPNPSFAMMAAATLSIAVFIPIPLMFNLLIL